MKYLLLLTPLILFAFLTKAQTKYGFVYAYNTTDKVLYVSFPVNKDNYSNCPDEKGYNSKMPIEKCMEKAFIRSLKIEIGSKYSSYSIKIRTCKYENSGYDCNDTFNSEAEAANTIKDVIAKYREQNYAYNRVSLN
jgi:hypothetical protein